MAFEGPFPSLDGFEETRQTLHVYSQAVAAIPRAFARPEPNWWHTSLAVAPDGLVTREMDLPDGGRFSLKMDLLSHKVLVLANGEVADGFSMLNGDTGSRFGERITASVSGLGLVGEYQRHRFESDEPRVYKAETVPPFLRALLSADRIFKEHRAMLEEEAVGKPGAVNFWTHGFDLSVEWYGSRVITYKEKGQKKESLAQLNLGFYPAEPPYFYSNPWPFEGDKLLHKTLPRGAAWHTDGWQGTILPYSELAGAPDAESRLRDYARRVFEIAEPTLTGPLSQ